MESLGPWGWWLVVPAGLIFAALAFVTRARPRRVGAALLTAALFGAGNVAWDLVGQPMGWWRYPAFVDRGYAPLLLYAVGGLVFGGGLGLVGWRAVRGFGCRGLIVFLVAFTLFGVLRDFRVSQHVDVIVFGPGVGPWLADAAAWASLAALVQAAHWLALGARRDEPLRARMRP